MNDILEMIDDLKELQVLYQTNDLRDFDLQNKIEKYERQIATFEAQMEMSELFFDLQGSTYDNTKEV